MQRFHICEIPLEQPTNQWIHNCEIFHKKSLTFVDDWAAALGAASWQIAVARLEALLQIVEDFEKASGSKINKGKSALVPSKRLSAQ